MLIRASSSGVICRSRYTNRFERSDNRLTARVSSSRGSTVLSRRTASAASPIAAGSAKTERVGRDIASGCPVRSTIIARWPDINVSSMGGNTSSARRGILRRAIFASTGLMTVTQVTRKPTTANIDAKTNVAITIRPRVRTMAARRCLSAAVSLNCSNRGAGCRAVCPLAVCPLAVCPMAVWARDTFAVSARDRKKRPNFDVPS